MLFHNKKLLNRVSIFTIIALCFCFIGSPIFATDTKDTIDWDKIKRKGNEIIDNYFNILEEDSYVVQLNNLFYPDLSKTNKKDPLEKIMEEAKAKIEVSGEKVTEEKIQKKYLELILIKVYSPLNQKLEELLKKEIKNYDEIIKKIKYSAEINETIKKIKYPAESNEIIKALGYGIGGTVVSTVILSVIVSVKISCMSLLAYVGASIAAWWAGTTLVGATTSSTVLGPWGVGTVVVVGGVTAGLYIWNKKKEAEKNKKKAYEELKNVIGRTEQDMKTSWLETIDLLKN